MYVDPRPKTMDPEQAKALVLFESREDQDSVLAAVRRGEDPGSARMRRLIDALRTLYHVLNGRGDLDRQVAAALYALGSDIPLTVSSMATKGRTWRKELMDVEVYELLVAVQSIFEDRWLDPESADTVH